MKRQTLMILLVLGLAPLAARGAEPDSHRQAAEELLKTMDLERTMLAGSNAMLDAQIRGNPALAPYRDVLQAWVAKYITKDAVGPKMTELYMNAFTEAELRDLSAFYKTPTGRKAMTTMPNLIQQGAQLGMEIAQKHTPELQEMIRARKEELEKAKKP
jgi:hypothetical protein